MFKNLSPGTIGIRATTWEAIEMARNHGFNGIDFSIVEAAELGGTAGVEEVVDRFTDAGIQYGGWGLPVPFTGSEEEWKNALKSLPELATIARNMGATRALTGIMPFSDTREYNENYDFHVQRLNPIANILNDHGLRLGMEFIGPITFRRAGKYEFIYGLTDTLKLCADVGPNAGLLLDLWHWYTSHGTQEELDHLSNKQIVAVHVNDAPAEIDVDEQMDTVRCLPGETGVLDIKGFLDALERAGYDGPVTPEPFSQRVNDMKAGDALKVTSEAMERVWTVG